MSHHIYQAAGLVEPLDEGVPLYLKEIIRNGCRRDKTAIQSIYICSRKNISWGKTTRISQEKV